MSLSLVSIKISSCCSWIFIEKLMNSWFSLFSPPSPLPSHLLLKSGHMYGMSLSDSQLSDRFVSPAPRQSSTSHSLYFCLLEVAPSSDLHYLVSGFREPIQSFWFPACCSRGSYLFSTQCLLIETVSNITFLYDFSFSAQEMTTNLKQRTFIISQFLWVKGWILLSWVISRFSGGNDWGVYWAEISSQGSTRDGSISKLM